MRPGGDVVAAEVGDEALELLEPAGAAVVGVEVYGAAVDAGFDAVLGVRDDGGVAGDGAGVSAVEREALADAQGGEAGERFVFHLSVDFGLFAAVEEEAPAAVV